MSPSAASLPASAINALAARWIRTLPDRATVCSALGVWPLLAILADAAEGPARAQLADAIGTDPSHGTDDGLATLRWLDATDATSGALGLWRRAELPIRSEWLARLPRDVAATFRGDAAEDQATIDAWARERTGGLIERMPVRIGDSTTLLLASALTLNTTWTQRFSDRHHESQPLNRITSDPSIVRATDEVTCVCVEGDNGIDVHLITGAPAIREHASATLAAGLGVVAGQTPARDGADLGMGASAPGVWVAMVDSFSEAPQVSLTLPAFTVRASHDLLGVADVFGLEAISDCSRGHTPAISDVPLCVGAARQDAMAAFSESGFRAAAVTTMGMVMAAAMRSSQPDRRARRIMVTMEQPFGFIATHRASGTVLFAGWVAG